MNNRFKYRLWDELEQKFNYYDLLNSESVFNLGYDADELMYDYNDRITLNHNNNAFICLEQGCSVVDDNNKNLYEGDIVNITRYINEWSDEKTEYIGIIKYFSDFNSLGIETIDKQFNTAFAIDKLITNIKLLGNIHQNKDILKDYNYE